MLGVGLFIALWVVLALILVYVASRRGRGGTAEALARRTRGTNRLVGGVFVFVLLTFGIGLPAAILIGNRDTSSHEIGGYKLTASEKTGRELFGMHCAVCHTLAASNAVGKVGPNLDTIRPASSLVLHTINNGCLPNAPNGSSEQCLGEGVMPADVVQGRAAQDVANFVALVAGRE